MTGSPAVKPANATPNAGVPLVLASASPRRRELLTALGAVFTIIATDAEESEGPVPEPVLARLPPVDLPARHHPTLLAWRKAAAAAAQAPESVVLGADTVVVRDGAVLNKPADAAEARAMLTSLSGRAHIVYTGLCVIKRAGKSSQLPAAPGSSDWPTAAQVWLELVAAEVTFTAVTAAEIAEYVATGEPLDKAGAYGVQGLGGRLVRAVRGSYTAVVGLPLVVTHTLLTAADITGLADPGDTYRRWLQSQGKEPLPCPPTLP